MTLTQRLLTEDPDQIWFTDIPGFEQAATHHEDRRYYGSEGALVFGLLDGEFVSADSQDRSIADGFVGGHIPFMIHLKLWLQNRFDEGELAALEHERQEIATLLANEVFDYYSLQAYEESDGNGLDEFKERCMEEYSALHGPPPEVTSAVDEDALFQWEEKYFQFVEDALYELWGRIESVRQALWKNEEDLGSEDARTEYFELPGRAWRVLNDQGDDVIFISFWGGSEHPRLQEVIAQVRDMLGGGPDAETWYEDTYHDEWFNAAPARPNADGSIEPVAAPAQMLSFEIKARINRLNAKMHTATPEEKDKIRAEIADLRRQSGEEVDPKAGAGSKRAGKAASAAGFDHAAGFHAARRHETVIRELENAVR